MKDFTKVDTVQRFFNGNKKLSEEIKLTEEEISLFECIEWKILCSNGLRQISGGWSAIEIMRVAIDDENRNPTLICKAGCGVQDEDGRELNEWQMVFDRVTKKFI